MVRRTLKILQHLQQDFESVSDHFGTLCIEGLNQLKKMKYCNFSQNKHKQENFP